MVVNFMNYSAGTALLKSVNHQHWFWFGKVVDLLLDVGSWWILSIVELVVVI
ncbi:hypothetical protein ACLB1T_29515 [Escherichia coli]